MGNLVKLRTLVILYLNKLPSIKKITAIFIMLFASNSWADCAKKNQFDLANIRKRNLGFHEFTIAEEAKFQRYVNMTQGSPPDLAQIPDHKIYFVYQKSAQFCGSDGYGCTPESMGNLSIVQNGCVVFQITGSTRSLNKVSTGSWIIPTE